MKVILNIDDHIYSKMVEYCDAGSINIDTLFVNLFSKYILEPANIFDSIYEENGNVQELKEFALFLTTYWNEYIDKIELTIGTTEEKPHDRKILSILKYLNHAHMSNPYLLAEFFKMYFNNKK